MPLSNDPQKPQRLAAFYASMSEPELQQLAEDHGALTERARQILEAEFARRGLPFEIQNPSDSLAERKTRLVILQQFRDLPDALLAKSVLDSAGIPCFLADENTVRIDWLWSNLLGGVKLWVREDDAPQAAEMLSQDFSEEPQSADSGCTE
jgi:Putative prokaryotic signal transducing protein